MRFKPVILGIVSVALVGAMGITPALAYFTDTTSVEGGMTVNVTTSTDITETYGSRVKHVVVTNAADATAPVFVRAKVFSSLACSATGTSWAAADAEGWLVYGSSVAPGAQTDELLVEVTFPEKKSDANQAGAVAGDNYNVVVVYESTPVLYDEAGEPYADWSFILDSGN